jgi:hypothetical protein
MERPARDRKVVVSKKLAELLSAGLLTMGQPPTEDEEAVRDLCRCREANNLRRTKQRSDLGNQPPRESKATDVQARSGRPAS